MWSLCYYYSILFGFGTFREFWSALLLYEVASPCLITSFSKVFNFPPDLRESFTVVPVLKKSRLKSKTIWEQRAKAEGSKEFKNKLRRVYFVSFFGTEPFHWENWDTDSETVYFKTPEKSASRRVQFGKLPKIFSPIAVAGFTIWFVKLSWSIRLKTA